MTARARRQLALSASVFAAVMLLGAWPSTRAARVWSAIYCPLGNVVIAHQTFGRGGHARLLPLDAIERRATDNVTADAALSLTVDHFNGDLRLGVSTRRDAYLPLLILCALIAAAPLGARRRARILVLGVPVMLAVTVAATELLVIWTFTTQVQGIYGPSPARRGMIDLAYSALLAPPGNRFIVPLILGVALIAWQSRRHERRVFATAPSSTDTQK